MVTFLMENSCSQIEVSEHLYILKYLKYYLTH